MKTAWVLSHLNALMGKYCIIAIYNNPPSSSDIDAAIQKANVDKVFFLKKITLADSKQ